MNAPLRLTDLVPGLVIAGGRRTVTEHEIRDFVSRSGSRGETVGRVRSVPDGGATAHAASGWLICAIAEQLAGTAVGTGCRSAGPPCIEMLRWPNAVHPGDNLELKIEILERHLSRSGSSALVRWRWVLATYQGKKVLDLVSATLIEDRAPGEKTPGVDAPIAYKVSRAAAMVGISRYLLYDAIRHRELRAYRPNARSDLMILPEDLREWVTRHPAEPKSSG
jgi:hypothetical protein